MSRLKHKIANARKYYQQQRFTKASEDISAQSEPILTIPNKIQLRSRDKKIPEESLKNDKYKKPTSSNIMKNYARAMVNFAISPLAAPYLEEFLEGKLLTAEAFKECLDSKKLTTNCISNFRELLLIKEGDSQETQEFKSVFGGICDVFLRRYSINWIYHSKISDKKGHLKCRGKILRRVQQPEFFTYLVPFVQKKPKKRSNENKD